MEEFVTLEGLKAYDTVKSTAVKVGSVPVTRENRVYLNQNTNEETTQAYAKNVELETRWQGLNDIEYVAELPAQDITSKMYATNGLNAGGSISESMMDNQSAVLGLYLDFANGIVKSGVDFKLDVSGTNKRVYTFEKVGSYYRFYDTDGITVIYDFEDGPTTFTADTVNQYYAGDRVNQTLTELATKDGVASTYVPLVQKGSRNGVATLDNNGKIPTYQLPTTALVYCGTWDATTHTFPTTGSGFGGALVSGDYYIVSVKDEFGNPPVEYDVGDWIVYNGSTWDLIEQTNDVHSVNGKEGDVVLVAADIDTDDTYTNITDLYNPGDSLETFAENADYKYSLMLKRMADQEAETAVEHTKQVSFYPTVADIPTVADPDNGEVFGIGEYAYAIATKEWFKVTAVDSSTKNITWTSVDPGFQRAMIAGDGIDIDNLTNTISNTSRVWEGTQAEYNLLTPAEKVGIALFLITDSIGTGVTVDDVVEDGNLNAVTSNAVYDAIRNSTGVKWVNTLPVSPNIESVVYVITSTSDIYIGNETSQITIPISAETVVWVSTLPVTGIKNVLYARTTDNKFYVGDETNQLLLPLSSSTQFIGTENDWETLSPAEQSEYELVCLTDVLGEGGAIVVDEVTNGNMNAVSSNAVYDALSDITTPNAVSSPITRNTTYTSAIGEIAAYKVGRLAQLHAYISLQNVPLNTITVVGNVVDSIKPIAMTEMVVVENHPSNIQYVRFWLDTAGRISVFITDAASQNIDFRVQATYITLS